MDLATLGRGADGTGRIGSRVAPRRPTPALAGALAAAGAGSIGLWYQLFRRPLPKTRGRTRVKGLEGPVTIERDERGVPRIEARSTHDLCFAQGFVHGQDRLWQLEFYSRPVPARR